MTNILIDCRAKNVSMRNLKIGTFLQLWFKGEKCVNTMKW